MRSAAPLTYVVPLRWEGDDGLEELARYLGDVSRWAEVIVVDGSDPAAFERHGRALDAAIAHVPPDRDLTYAMGKVNGVISGVQRASHERVVLADDDVRYEHAALAQVARRLDSAELVVPQNYFDPLPWHARWDTARSLLNRVATGDPWFRATDFPGTLGIRRGAFLDAGAYDGDAIFENLELMRTIRAAGGRVAPALDVFVRRLPPETSHFLSQRVRQAYDDFAIPARMGGFLALGPLALSARRRHRFAPLGIALGSIALAEIGRRRAGGTAVYPPSASLLAPAWLCERMICAWLALGCRLRGGVRYGDRRVVRSANSARRLRRRAAARRPRTQPTYGSRRRTVSSSKPRSGKVRLSSFADRSSLRSGR